jgi:hypothetical protein
MKKMLKYGEITARSIDVLVRVIIGVNVLSEKRQ